MALASLSLEKTIASVMRRGMPEEALACAAAADRMLIENIAHLAQQVVPELDLTKADVSKVGDVYSLRMPWSGGEVRMSLASMREIESYSPYRIVDVCVKSGKDGQDGKDGKHGENACVLVQVASENKAIAYSSVDIVRIKRKCV
jgi:hypothetical protein